MEAWPRRAVALQYNLCVDAFSKTNGATLYVPRSHARNAWPRGVAAGDLPDGATSFTAPAGAAVLYDSRTWHRRPDERNASGRPRTNVLLALSHAWMRPMIDASAEVSRFVANGALSLPDRVRADAAALFATPAQVPPNAAAAAGESSSDISIEEIAIESDDDADDDDDDAVPLAPRLEAG